LGLEVGDAETGGAGFEAAGFTFEIVGFAL
jgi:hypothetical protein